MYIVRNALRSIARSKGRSILTGIIIFVIALASCLALSIREAAKTAKKEALSDLEITASIQFDRQSVMGSMENREEMDQALGNMQELSLEELETYAQADSVKSFYYTYSASMNAASIDPVDTSQTQTDQNDFPSNEGRPDNAMALAGDFTIVGYSSDEAMTDFTSGNSSITKGSVFEQGSADQTCIVNEELALYNDLEIGDVITLSNPNDEEETYELTISGIYQNEAESGSSFSIMERMSPAADAANRICVSAQTLQSVISASQTAGDNAVHGMLNGTYVFADKDDYEAFQQQVKEMGLSDQYMITSTDLMSFEQSIQPLQSLSGYAGIFLILILIIGGIILAVLNIFNIRERKYEIGVLSAIGMKPGKISLQFLCELLCITFCALFLGAGIGAAASVPMTNALLSQQIESSTQSAMAQNDRFGRASGENFGQAQMEEGETPPSMPKAQDGFGNQVVSYIDSVSSAVNLIVLLKLFAIGLLLAAVSSLSAVISILRYDPLRILSERD